MQTLIELYDERPLENVLGVEVFRPARVVYLCPEKLTKHKELRERMQAYFAHRGIEVELEFVRARVFDAMATLQTLRGIVAGCPDCALDITGGTDAVLYAAGMLGAELPIPAFTYSIRQSCFYDIRNAAFASGLPCRVHFSVEDCILMAGGSLRTGRVDNGILEGYFPDVEPFFRLYLRHRRQWVRIVTYFQRLSQANPEGPIPLQVRGDYVVKGERGSRIEAPEEALRDLETIGFLKDLQIDREKGVSFAFRDHQIRFWLRDVGSVLELYVYKAFVDAGLFDDIRLSVQVDWEANEQQKRAVTNELDVMATRGISPIFVSCKIGEARTEALNELAILRDRFGGKVAKAVVITAERGGAPLRNRATELGIQIIDREDLLAGKLGKRLRRLVDK
ncbi:MAG: DUF1887 family protein [Oscillospiraceae bacterium]|nr:DUF1887 family protein [Oscillospiraceae bacterium]